MLMDWRLLAITLLTAVTVEAQSSARIKPLVDEDALQQAGLTRYWLGQLPLTPGDTLEKVHLVDSTLYAITDFGSVFSITSDTGLNRWGAKVAEADYTIFPPSHLINGDGDGPTIIPTTTEILIYDRFDGELFKRFKPPFPISGQVIAKGRDIYFGSADSHFYAMRMIPGEGQTPFKRWEVMAGGPVTTAPLLYDGRMLIFASQAGQVFACRTADKAFRWSARTAGPITADPAMDGSGVYVPSTDRSLYKFNLATGDTMWRYQFPSPLTVGPQIVGRTVFQWSQHSGLIALNANNGEEKWRCKTGLALIAHTEGGDLIQTNDRRLVIVNHQSGQVMHELETPSVTGVVTNPHSDSGFLYNGDGRIQCVRLSRVPYLRRQQILAAQRELNKKPRREDDHPSKVNADTTHNRSRDPFRSRRDGGK